MSTLDCLSRSKAACMQCVSILALCLGGMVCASHAIDLQCYYILKHVVIESIHILYIKTKYRISQKYPKKEKKININNDEILILIESIKNKIKKLGKTSRINKN